MESPRERPISPTNTLPSEDELETEANRPNTWPKSVFRVAKAEKPKFYRMSAMFFLIAYVYSVLRDTKDAIVMSRQEASSISFLKTLYVLPASILSVLFIQRAFMNNRVGIVLKNTLLVFAIYFTLYASFFLPFQKFLEPRDTWAIDMFNTGSMSMKGLDWLLSFVLTINFWTSSLLYVTSELWGNIVLSLLFLSYSNDVCTFRQSLRFIPMFYIISNFGLMLSGMSMYGFYQLTENLPENLKQYVINGIFGLCAAICISIYFLQRSLETNILPRPIFSSNTEQVRTRNAPRKISFLEGCKLMMKSKVLLHMCFIVLAYNICTNLIDTIFKSSMKAYAVEQSLDIKSSVMKFQAFNQIFTSFFVILLLSTPFSRIVQIYGWRFGGFITPSWAIISCFLVLFLSIYNTSSNNSNHLSVLNNSFNTSKSYLLVETVLGMIAASGLKITKYAAFDISIEALSMRIIKEDRAVAKSVYAGLCGKIGKSSGSLITIMTIALTNTLDLRCSAQYVFAIIIFFGVLWKYAVTFLGSTYKESINSNTEMILMKREKSKTLEEQL